MCVSEIKVCVCVSVREREAETGSCMKQRCGKNMVATAAPKDTETREKNPCHFLPALLYRIG